ncbi:hypothetical protein CHK_0067 [Christensenella hongkongensis]|uniref:Uncharacterized protein n=1 Tax=Christensenella hongkongensis TaxID=270498 RepID=A0A0M2NQG6_9FIRM|nr:hypothetical protein CHK_0067 [Christensenella hongkongensis]
MFLPFISIRSSLPCKEIKYRPLKQFNKSLKKIYSLKHGCLRPQSHTDGFSGK